MKLQEQNLYKNGIIIKTRGKDEKRKTIKEDLPIFFSSG